MLNEVCSKITDKGITVERQYSMIFKSWILILGLVLSRPKATRADGPTYVYIDTVSGYDELSKCAEIPLSTFVRNMENCCRDGSQLTSYSCFCTNSYQKFNFDISTAVLAQCGQSLWNDIGEPDLRFALFFSICITCSTTQSSSRSLNWECGCRAQKG